MATTTKLDLSLIALRNADTLADLALKLEQDGIWQGSEPILDSVAHTLRRMFDLLALDDHKLTMGEARIFNALAAHPLVGTSFSEERPQALGEDTMGRLPDALRAAIEQDRREGTNMTGIALGAIETLAHTIVSSRGSVSPRDRKVVRALMSNLRNMSAVLLD